MRQKNTINRATQHLPRSVRMQIRDLFRMAGCMDLDYHDLATYLQVIKQVFAETRRDVKKMAAAMRHVQDVVDRYRGDE